MFLDPVLGWLLYIHPALAIIIVAFIVSMIVTLALKYFTNQKEMKSMKEGMQRLQKEMKNSKNNAKKLGKINSELMDINMKYMSQSMRPTLYTFIPIIIIFGWLNANLAYYPISPGERFGIVAHFDKKALGDVSLTVPNEMTIAGSESVHTSTLPAKGAVSWNISAAAEGTYDLRFAYNGKNYTKDVIITKGRTYAAAEKSFMQGFIFKSSDGGIEKITIDYKKILPFVGVPVIHDIPWIGTWSWFGVYIVFSIIFSMLLRKWLNVY
ncbi:MAG: DUF106 domain-containing protein [Nanoarchaeota archaeon]|nr:DUF106 domain-containing protein [Nanoarchaeota archaeon]